VNSRSSSSVISDVKSLYQWWWERFFFYSGTNSEVEANPYIGQVVTDTPPDEEHVSPTCPNRVKKRGQAPEHAKAILEESHTEDELVSNIVETFRALQKINMKLNPKKCTFGATEGMFLGYLIEPDGIKPCPEKTKAVIQLPSPRTMKEVQSLNGKLAGLNRFLSKSADKSLPLFQTLKKCTNKGDFRWTTAAEDARSSSSI
ncbi:hypothetical protein Tco_1551105, partial [Tanacetum coccineum]